MTGQIRFISDWQDIDWVFEKGDEISLSPKEVDAVRERMKTSGKNADLCAYGLHLVPLSFLEELKDDDAVWNQSLS